MPPCGWRAVRLYKTDREKKRFVFMSFEKIYRPSRDLVITMGLAVPFKDHNAVRLVLGTASAGI